MDVECENFPGGKYQREYDTPHAFLENLFKYDMLEVLKSTAEGDFWNYASSSPIIQVYVPHNFLNDRSCKPNQCVRAITGGKAIYRWAGPIMVMKQMDSEDERLVDVDEDTLKAVTKFLQNCN